MEEKEPNLTDREEEIDTPSGEHIGNYKGPIIRSKTKKMKNILLLKANILMPHPLNDYR